MRHPFRPHAGSLKRALDAADDGFELCERIHVLLLRTLDRLAQRQRETLLFRRVLLGDLPTCCRHHAPVLGWIPDDVQARYTRKEVAGPFLFRPLSGPVPFKHKSGSDFCSAMIFVPVQ